MPEQSTPIRRFSLVRSFHLADFFTLANGGCGMMAIFYCLDHLLHPSHSVMPAFILLPMGGFFDWVDGRVARYRNNTSLLGQELDSLSDLITFGVAPAILAFTVGCREFWDRVILVAFVLCALARLARYNATVAALPKGKGGGIKYFEGMPVPSSLLWVSWMAYEVSHGQQGWLWTPWHILYANITPISWIILANATAMVSRTLHIPKI